MVSQTEFEFFQLTNEWIGLNWLTQWPTCGELTKSSQIIHFYISKSDSYFFVASTWSWLKTKLFFRPFINFWAKPSLNGSGEFGLNLLSFSHFPKFSIFFSSNLSLSTPSPSLLYASFAFLLPFGIRSTSLTTPPPRWVTRHAPLSL